MHPSGAHPDPADLVAYTEGDAQQEVEAHVAMCSKCAQEARALGVTAAALARKLYRFDCPDALRLGEYALDMLDAVGRQQTAAHAVECELCSADLVTLRQYLATDPPVRESVAQRVRRVVATLLTPPAGAPAFAPLRGTASTAPRVYRADGVTLNISTGDEPGHVLGLLQGEVDMYQLQGRAVRLISEQSDAAFTTDVDDLGAFELEDLPPGAYTLEVELPGTVLVVEGLQVR